MPVPVVESGEPESVHRRDKGVFLPSLVDEPQPGEVVVEGT